MGNMRPRSYQRELIELASHGNNVLISLDTGSGKTLIAAEVIRAKLQEMKAKCQVAVFLAPSNPLVSQQHDVMQNVFGFQTKAYHGNEDTSALSSWDKAKWDEEWQAQDVLVMTPEVLLHILAHGFMTLANVGLLVFDECHHCHHNHPYNQLMEDFRQPLPAQLRPQVVALTASPDGMLPNKKKGKPQDPGLQSNLDSQLLSAQHREDVEQVVHLPDIRTKEYLQPAKEELHACTRDALAQLDRSLELMKHAAKCETLSELVRKGEQLAEGMQDDGLAAMRGLGLPDDAGSGFEAARLEKQIRAVKTCLEELGPWCAAAAAYLNLLAPSNAAEAPIPEQADGMVGLELMQLMQDDDVGDGDTLENLRMAQVLLAEELVSRTSPQVLFPTPLLTKDELFAAVDQQPAAGLAWHTAALVQMAVRVALTETIAALAVMLLRRESQRQQLVSAFHEEAKADLQQQGEGKWQCFAAVLMEQVPWGALEAQALLGPSAHGGWDGPPLVTPKLAAMLGSLCSSLHAHGERGWAAMVFVETRLSALVLGRLVNSLPGVRAQLRASEFVGTSMMDQNMQRRIMEAFRRQELNVLVATNVGSEGMDFRQCCLVLAMDEPQTVTHFIQCRGRARAAGSVYELMVKPGWDKRCRELQSKTEQLQQQAHQLSDRNRQHMRTGQLPSAASGANDFAFAAAGLGELAPESLETDAGARVTMRLAQPLLAEYCAKLPGTEGYTLLQPYYYTRQVGMYLTTVYLPSNSDITDPVFGKPQRTRPLARQSAALAALLRLHEAGQLNDHLQPTWGSPHAVAQMKVQPVPPFKATSVLPSVLKAPATAGQAGTGTPAGAASVTMQLYAFQLSLSHLQQQMLVHQAPGTGTAEAAAIAHESAPLASPATSAAAGTVSTLQFGVLLRQRLPAGLLPAFGAWMPWHNGQQYMVSVAHVGPVKLQPAQAAALVACQHVLEKHITLPKSLQQREARPGDDGAAGSSGHASCRPSMPGQCIRDFGFDRLQQAVACLQQGQSQQHGSQQGCSPGSSPADALAYVIVPLRSTASAGITIDWNALHDLAAGPVPALDIVSAPSNSNKAARTAAAAHPSAAKPAASAQQAAGDAGSVGPAAVRAAAAHLQGRMLISQHHYKLWRCTGLSSLTCGEPASWLPNSMSHQQLFALKHGYTGKLRGDLPMLEVRDGRGFRQKTCLKPQQDTSPAPADAAAAGAVGKAAGASCECLPLKVSWVLPLPRATWEQLYYVPALMYRLEGLLRLQGMQQQLAPALPASVAMPPLGLLFAAITAKQAKEQFNNERLEFIGDAVLKYLATSYLLQTRPSATEGELSFEKAKLVRNFHLATQADQCLPGCQHTFNAFLRLFAFDRARCTPSGMAQDGQKLQLRKGKAKADMMEALIGAFYLTAAAGAAAPHPHAAGSSRSSPHDGGVSMVSQLGLVAAAQLCEALGAMPKGSAATASMELSWPQPQRASAFSQAKATRLAAELAPVLGGYRFRRPALLQQALTHVSVLGAPSYQRLELLGDAVLDVLVSLQLLLVENRTLGPGELTLLRQARVKNNVLAERAIGVGLHRHIAAQAKALPWLCELGASTDGAAANPAKRAATEAALAAARGTARVASGDCIWGEVWAGAAARGQQEQLPGQAYKHKVLADIVESVTAAVFVDSGGNWDATWDAMGSIVDVNSVVSIVSGDFMSMVSGNEAQEGASSEQEELEEEEEEEEED